MHEAAVPVDENCLSPTLPAFRHAQQRSPGLCDAQWTLHGGGNAGRAETHGANPPVAPLKWGAAPHAIALGKTLAP